MNEIIRAALKLHDRGFAVAPTKPNSKQPATRGWQKRRLSRDELEAWLRKHPDAGIGVVCGAMSGNLVVIDFDGKDWAQAYDNLLYRLPQLARAPRVRTASGRVHIWVWCPDLPAEFTCGVYRMPGCDARIEFRGNGHFAVAPPTRLGGGKYSWDVIDADEIEISYLDLLDAVAPWCEAVRGWGAEPDITTTAGGDVERAKVDGAKPVVDDIIPEGARNNTLTTFAGTLRRQGLGEESIAKTLLSINRNHCKPPLPEAEVLSIARSVARYEPAAPAVEYPQTDQGNAERLVARHGRGMRYVGGRWLVWDGRRWAVDDTQIVRRLAVDTVRSMYAEAAGIEDEQSRKERAKWALRSESRRALDAMVALAEPLVAVRESDFDRDPYLLNAANGTINLKTGEIREHRRDDMITRLAGAEYHPDAWHPDADTPWNRFLRDVTGGDEELMAFLQRVVGYSITGDVREEVFFIIHGPPGSGKSTFVEAVRAALGDYARQADFETFLRRPPTGAPRNDIARLAGARLVASIEVERGRQLAEALVKQLTGGDTIAARFLYREAFEFTPQFKLFLVANILPRADDLDPGLWRRVICIPFLHVVPDARRDNQLKQRLRSEARDEILAWAVRGCLDWRRVGLQPPQVVKQAVAEYREQQDPLRDWLQACCVIGQAYYATSAELWESFQAFGGGISRREFNERLKALGCKADKGRQGNRVWRGIGLLPSP